MTRAAGVIMRDLYMENLILPAATMCINVQKPGVPDSVEQKRALCPANNFIHLTTRDLNRSHAWISEVVSTQCASASDEIWRIKKKLYSAIGLERKDWGTCAFVSATRLTYEYCKEYDCYSEEDEEDEKEKISYKVIKDYGNVYGEASADLVFSVPYTNSSTDSPYS
ncbi:hypothetical protein V1477_020545 [Vespula maculifrons]|uniref:Uncharacterized protein n=1 Tax=Vespula maculifrons TaxID=7453 RepID=A0ABD2AMG9_VESMC